jgi:hypothetical protein
VKQVQKALRALTKLCNFLLSGQLPSEICHLLYGASLCALNKKDGGLRPIAIGNCLRRLTSKLACFQSRNIVNSYLSPHQLGVATKLGCEASIHTTRTFVNNDQNRGKVLLKLDFKNAFNSVERDCILKEVQCHTPLLYPYLYQCYRDPSTLFFGDHLISSSVGAQQGDPCGPMIFSLAIQPIILSLDSELNIWYLDDGTLPDYPEVVLSDFKKVINLSRKIGLELNFNKCEIFNCSGDTDLKVIKEFQNLAPGIKICDRESLSLLGSPIFDQGFKNTVEKTIITVENLLNKAELLNRHVAYNLIKNCLFIRKLTRCFTFKDLGVTFDAQFTFNEHVDIIVASSVKTLGFIFRSCKRFRSESCLRALYFTLVRSKLEYCSIAWSPIYRRGVDALESVQRKFAKYLLFKLIAEFPPRGTPNSVLYDMANLRSLNMRRNDSFLIFLYKIIHGIINSPFLLSQIYFNVPRANLRSGRFFYVPRAVTNILHRSPLYTACTLFNSNCSECDIFVISLGQFKRLITCISEV